MPFFGYTEILHTVIGTGSAAPGKATRICRNRFVKYYFFKARKQTNNNNSSNSSNKNINNDSNNNNIKNNNNNENEIPPLSRRKNIG